jgi:hypothetical protein
MNPGRPGLAVAVIERSHSLLVGYSASWAVVVSGVEGLSRRAGGQGDEGEGC